MAGRARDEEPAGDHGEDADRDVDEEDRAPVEAPEIGADQQAAEDRAADRGEAGGEAEQREGQAALLGREGDGARWRGPAAS